MGGRVQRHNQRVKKLALAVLLSCSAFAQISQKPPDAIVPVAGSLPGQNGAFFRTELQMHNATGVQQTGWIVFRPAGNLRRYDLAPHATLSFADVVSELGATGLGSLDILVDKGALPVVIARAYDDQPTGTTGVSLPVVRGSEALLHGTSVTLIAPSDGVRYRFNAGVRALESGATLAIDVRASSGVSRATRTVTLEADEFVQQPGSSLAGIPLAPDDALEIEIVAGSAIIYATTVDNLTNDSSLQLAR
jgi:hypothetical protein